MRIVILTQYFLPEMGAPQSRLYETAIGLKQRGWQVKVVTAMPNYPQGRIQAPYRLKFAAIEILDGIEVSRYTLYPSRSKHAIPRIISMLSFSFTALFAVRMLRKFKPDYIITESPPLTLGITGIALAKASGARHILNVSDIWPLSAYKLGAIANGNIYSRLKKIEKYLYRHSWACLGQSQQIVNYLSKNGCSRTLLYRNGVDTKRFSKQSKANTFHSPLKIVYAGLLGVAQGILDLCSNVNFLELGVEFHIYGNGAERKEIEHFVSENSMRGIFLHETVGREKMPGLLAMYDVTLITLVRPLYGAVPSKLYEAMAAGLPVIFAGGGEGAEIVKAYEVGWTCTPGNYAEIKQTINAVCTMQPDQLRSVQHNGRKAAENVFDRKIQLDKLHDLLLKGI